MSESETSGQAQEKTGGSMAEPAADLKTAAAAIGDELRAAAIQGFSAIRRSSS
jgi:hypothetical protein